MDPRVPATVALHLAKAELKVAELERQEAATPMITRNSDARIALGRKLRVARELAVSWRTLAGLVAGEELRENREAALKKEFTPAPNRIVAQVDLRDGTVYCNRAVCYSVARKGADLSPYTADDFPDGGVCFHCGTDVLA